MLTFIQMGRVGRDMGADVIREVWRCAGALQRPCGTLSIALAHQSARGSCPPLICANLTCRVGLQG